MTASQTHTPTKDSLVKRLRGPAGLAALGIVLWFTGRETDLSADGLSAVAVATRVSFVLAAGWLITTLVDMYIKGRIAALDMTVADNLTARKAVTRLDVLRRVWVVVGVVATAAAALTVVPWARQIGLSLFASAGIAGIAIGLAARPVLANLIAGLQIAFTQPIRIDDALVVENEWGWVEEIGLFYVVIRLWDWRRLIVPLSHFIEKPFQNWTRESASIIGTVMWSLDYRTPIAAMREHLKTICESSPLWDNNIVNLQVTDTDDRTIKVRALASAKTSPEAWDLRCFIREEMIRWLQQEHPEALPRFRAETAAGDSPDWVLKPDAALPTDIIEPEIDASLSPDAAGAAKS